MSLRYINSNTRVEVKSMYDDTPYITVVHEILEGGRLLLDIMRLGGEETRLSINKPYLLRFFSDRGVFKFTAVLRGYMRKGEFDFMLFQTADDGEKVQRRQSFRLNCGEEIDFTFAEGEDTDVKNGFVRDISGGGVRMLTMDEVDASQLLRLRLPMIAPDFWVYGTILSKQAIEDAKYKWQFGIEFIGTTAADTEKIVMHIHNEQQKARARK